MAAPAWIEPSPRNITKSTRRRSLEGKGKVAGNSTALGLISVRLVDGDARALSDSMAASAPTFDLGAPEQVFLRRQFVTAEADRLRSLRSAMSQTPAAKR